MSKRLTTEEWVEKAKALHGNRIDFSKVVYVNARTNVTLICPVHGEISVSPTSYLKSKSDCPYCGGTGKKTTSAFIKECQYKFPNEHYDYSKVNYINSSTVVTITCPIHGDFEVIPSSFLQGHHCPTCGRERGNRKISLSLEEFINKAKEVHGNKYDYSKVEYKNNRTKICIICPEHGEFWQTPNVHLSSKCGCPQCGHIKCGHIKCGDNINATQEFIARAINTHGDKYDYSKVTYTDHNDKVTIICPKHGEFKQTPASHLSGSGCPTCATERIAEACKLTKEQFIKNSKYWHGDRYDYSKVEYVNNYTPVTIICKEHGEFKQLPSNHMDGAGCPLCEKTSNGEKSVIDILTSNQIEYIPQYKLPSKVNPSGFMFVDFYLPNYNIFIEYNGIQHYEKVNIWKNQFERQQARDEELRQYCKENNIKLIEIRYDEDVWTVLHERLFIDNVTMNNDGHNT